jgi:hypothetical protein
LSSASLWRKASVTFRINLIGPQLVLDLSIRRSKRLENNRSFTIEDLKTSDPMIKRISFIKADPKTIDLRGGTDCIWRKRLR